MGVDASAILFQPGQAYTNPTDLTAAAPYGGTALGKDEFGCVLYPNFIGEEIEAIDHGADLIDVLHVGMRWEIESVLMQFDSVTKPLAFPGMADITSGTIQAPGEDAGDANAWVPGNLWSSKAVRWLYVPDDAEGNDIILCHNSIIMMQPNAEIPWSPEDPSSLMMSLKPLKKNIASGQTAYKYRTIYIGPLSGAELNTS